MNAIIQDGEKKAEESGGMTDWKNDKLHSNRRRTELARGFFVHP